MKIVNVCYDDYANYMHGITLSLRAAGADCKEFKMIAHPFGYAQEAPVCRIEEMIPAMREADVINIFHTSNLFLPVVKALTPTTSHPSTKTGEVGTARKVTVWHTGTKYRQSPKEMNELFNPVVDATFTDQCEFALLGAKKLTYIAAAVEMNDTKRCTRMPYRFAHYPNNKTGEDTKGSKIIQRYLTLYIRQGYSNRASYTICETKVSHREQIDRMRKCDIYVELFAPEQNGKPYGCYGVTAFEAAAMGKAVITQNSYANVYKQTYGVDLPFHIVNTEKELGQTIEKLCLMHNRDIAHMQQLHRSWVLQHHSYEATGKLLLNKLLTI